MAEASRRIQRERLSRLVWELGHYYPIPLRADQITISVVRPRLGCLCWHISGESIARLRQQREADLYNAGVIVRVYDVTDIIFNGRNAHMFFDIEVSGQGGNYYFSVERTCRNYLAELGIRSGEGSFHPLARSGTAFFDRDRPSGNYEVGGLFVGMGMSRIFPVDNVFDAPVYEKMNRQLSGLGKPVISAAFLFPGKGGSTRQEGALGSFVGSLSERIAKFGGTMKLFPVPAGESAAASGGLLPENMTGLSEIFAEKICSAHGERPFDLIHCHDWHSSMAGIEAAKTLRLPMIFSLHEAQYERMQGSETAGPSSPIRALEREAVRFADLVIVPHSSTRQQAITLYGASPEKVVIIPDVVHGNTDFQAEATEIKGRLGLDPGEPIILFSGEMSHASGADILVDAIGTVCRNHRSAQFVFAGDGPLKGELESRACRMGVGHRCRFLGDVPKEIFDALLISSDFVVIPARTWQGEGLAQIAISAGRPVLTTRQAGINCVVHGQNGLVTFDNPGSIVWGIQELLFNPLQGNMMKIAARKKANESPTIETIAAQHYTCYGMVARRRRGESGV